MNFKLYINKLFFVLGVSVLVTSCFNDLDTVPIDEDEVTSAKVYEDPNAYRQVLAKLYAGLAVSGQQGPSGQADIAGIDEGFGQYLRAYWYHQELPTDEAVIGWNDQTIKDFHDQDWDANDVFINAYYSRIFYQISLCNEYLRETTEDKLDGRGVDGTLRSDVGVFRAEARFLRALSYYHALDAFGNVPFVTEEDAVGAFFPDQISRADLYNFIESELKAVEPILLPARSNEYGRADQGALWMLLAKLYLNAEVYTGNAAYTEAAEYSEKVIGAGYKLEEEFSHLFMADNDGSDEIIFPINFDGVNTLTFGGTNFIIHAAVGGNMNPADFGIDGGWGGTRTTSALVNKFPSLDANTEVVTPVEGNSANYSLLNVPGGFQGWDPAANSTALASVNNDSNYEGYLYFAEAGEFKFALGGWDNNWGDSDGDGLLEKGGDNLSVAEPGLYKINVDTTGLAYTVQKTEWGLIGSSTPGGWDADTDMTYIPDENVLSITLELVAGEVKFRANDDWGINYGDTGADAVLELGGDNIIIPSDGVYTLKLFLDRPDYTYSIARPSFDSRALFHTDGQELEIADISQFTEGYAVTKFKNVTSTGVAGSDLRYADTDFPMFRLADAYLMYAEAVLRGGSGSIPTAVEYINLVRNRAYGDASGNIQQADLSLDFLLDERARELAWECHRRTDLIRFNRFSNSDYLWPWKGGVAEGAVTAETRDLFPIPSNDISANPKLKQNAGY